MQRPFYSIKIAMPPIEKLIQKLQTSWTPRGLLLFILPLPLVPAMMISLIRGDLTKAIIHLFAIALFVGGAVLIRHGLVREAELDHRHLKVAYKLPIKTFGAISISLATASCAYLSVQHSLAFSTMLGFVTFLGVYFSYGLDEKKKTNDIEGFTSDDVIDALSQAIKKITAIEQASHTLKNQELRLRLERITLLAREIVKLLEDSPQDLHRARKFLYVYLDGAQQVSAGYAKTHNSLTTTTTLENNFRDVLVTIESVFEEQKTHLIENELLDLDIKIEVLSTQLRNEI